MKALDKALEVAAEYGERAWCDTYEIRQNEWQRNGKHRIYIDLILYPAGKRYKVGYVDVTTDTFVKTI